MSSGGMTGEPSSGPAIFIDLASRSIDGPEVARLAANALRRAMEHIGPKRIDGPGLVKVHIGEPKCTTAMRPELAQAAAEWMLSIGAGGVAAGDTTVAYTGDRGHRQNPAGNCAAYLGLARSRGWSEAGPAGMPFVVLDRPSTAIRGSFDFNCETVERSVHGLERFKDVELAAGFDAAAFTVNHAHLTLHGLAGVAGCVKSVAMGLSGLKGKLRMHQSLLPEFDADLCVQCGRCVESCPERALALDSGGAPEVSAELCIGCGECEAVCAPTSAAVRLASHDITDWARGADTLPLRMADYAVGLLSGRWSRVLHVLHLYTMTERCDCLDVRQRPMVSADIGLIVGWNPFAVDLLGARMLRARLAAEGREADEALLGTAERAARYCEERYGMPSETDVVSMCIESGEATKG